MISPARKRPGRQGVTRLVLAGAIAAATGLAGRASAESMVGRVAPDCELALRGEKSPVAIQQFRGGVTYVDFWASWCAPCLVSFPFMEGLQKDFAARGLRVLAVNMDRNPSDAARFLSRHGAVFPVALGDNEACARRFAVETMPTSFLIDRKGTIRRIHPGFRPGEEAALRAWVSQALAEPER
jgi:thiol-disulfide isomerase/thioredoxin